MAKALSILRIPPDVTDYAERFGAQRDSATGTWFVVGPVPNELLNYVPQPKNQRFQDVAPRCPKCRAPTRKLINRKGDLYWACVMRFKTDCPGVIDYLKYLDDVAPLATVGSFLPKVAGSLFEPEESSASIPEMAQHPLKERWVEIASEALTLLGNDKQVLRWLDQPKVALGNKAPVLMLSTTAGCDRVLALLRDVWK